MPVRAPIKPLAAWSYSRLEAYDPTTGGCPRKAYLKFIRKLLDVPSVALAEGDIAHKSGEAYIKGQVDVLPEQFRLYQEECEALRRGYKKGVVLVEDSWNFTRKWEPCDVFAKDCWLRVKVDIAYQLPAKSTIFVRDWKTGKIRPSSELQMKLYNVSGLSRYPKMRIAKSKLSYLEHGEDKDDMMLSTEVAREREYWADRVAPMLADTTFEPNPGNACRWCPYSVGKQTTIPADIRAQHVAAMPKGENPCPF